jgi:hypothetical protein
MPGRVPNLRGGVAAWNAWRAEHPKAKPPELVQADLRNAELAGANLAGVNLSGATLVRADLGGADLSRARLIGANLADADLHGANLTRASLLGAYLGGVDLRRAVLCGAGLQRAVLVQTNLEGADLTGCSIYGLAAWDVKLDGATQKDLKISPVGKGVRGPTVRVDDIEVAQFIYLLLHNQKVRRVIDTVTSKVVLILGRFAKERLAVLDAMRDELRRLELVPILFDFDKPASKDVTGTVETLARLARFIVADLTDPSSIPHELATVVPFLRTTPVLPLRLAGSGGYSMFQDLGAYPWVLPVHEYDDPGALIASLAAVIGPAESMAAGFRESAPAE